MFIDIFAGVDQLFLNNLYLALIIFWNSIKKQGHDCSLRLWNLENKNCIQEMTAHRKKYDESINCVAFHPTKPFIASGGADAIVKIYVW